MEFVEHALQYAEKGFSVFALPVNGKVPRKDTNGFKDATRSQELIEEWWSENAHYNIGIKCGNFKGRCLVVIDIDKHGNDGYKGLSELEDLLGELPDTVTALTPTGGRHFYFLSAKALKNSAKFQGKDGVDVRAEGGYVVAPPSIHPDTKTPYRWENGKSPFEIPFAMLPNSWERAMEKNVSKDEKRTIEDVKFTKGNRVDSLVSLIGSLVRKGLNELEIRAAVDVANSMRCLPPLSPSEMETNVYPALTRNWLKEDPFWENIKVKSSYLPEPVPFDQVTEEDLVLAPELIKGTLRQGHKMMLSAPSKAGKSFGLLELAFAIAEGKPFFGDDCVQGKILYMNMEIDESSFFNRLNKIYAKLMPANGIIHKGNIVIWNLRGKGAPIDQLADAIIEESRGFNAIIIDPLYKVMMGNENDNSEMGKMVAIFDRIASETGASIIYAHHFAKGFGGDKNVIDRASGAGVFARDPDAMLTLNPLEDVENGFRVEYVLREFPNHKPVDVEFNYPTHQIHLDWKNVELEDSTSAKEKKKRKANQKKEETKEGVIELAESLRDESGMFELSDLEAELKKLGTDLSRPTIRKYLAEYGFKVTKQGKKGQSDLWGR